VSDMKKIKCTKCGKTKQSDRFHKDKNRKSGFAAWCKDCLSAHKRERLRSDPEYRARRNAKNAKYNRERRHNDPEYRAKADKRSVERQRERRHSDPEYRARRNAKNAKYNRERRHNDPEYRARRNAIRNKCERDSRKTAMFIKMIALGMALKNSVNSVPSVAGKNLRFEI